MPELQGSRRKLQIAIRAESRALVGARAPDAVERYQTAEDLPAAHRRASICDRERRAVDGPLSAFVRAENITGLLEGAAGACHEERPMRPGDKQADRARQRNDPAHGDIMHEFDSGWHFVVF